MTPVTAQTPAYNYDAYMKALNDASDSEAEYDEQNTLLYDVAFLATDEDGNLVEVQPAEGTVTVKFDFKQQQLSEGLEAKDAADVTVTHLPLAEGIVDEAGTTARAKDISAADVTVEAIDAAAKGDNTLEMTVSDFSVYAFSYTVDFTYDGFTYSFPGQGSYPLVDVLAALGIEGAIDDATLEIITGKDREGALYLTQKDGAWFINSDIAFTDTYQLTVTSGHDTYIIDVTDAGNPIDISNTLTSVYVTVDGVRYNANTPEGQSIDMTAGKSYKFELGFQETDDLQFANDDTEMYYTLPSNVTFENIGNTFDISLGSLGSVKGNTYRFEDGKLYIKFNTSDPNFPLLRMGDEARMKFEVTGSLGSDQNHINWQNGISTNSTVNEQHDASIHKTGYYDANDNKIHYTVTVDSQGTTSGIRITDTLRGSALTSDVNSASDITVTKTDKNHQQSSVVPSSFQKNGNEFTIQLPDMVDGDHYEVKYTASVNLDMLEKSGTATYDESANGVKLQWNESPDPETDESFGYNISTGTIDKSVTEVGDVVTEGDKQYRYISYKIVSNPERKTRVSYIYDEIRSDSVDRMQMAGDGITVKVTKEDNTTETRTINWGQNGLTKNSNSKWTYNPPSSDGKATYEITYQTKVDVTGLTKKINVNNDAHDSNSSDGNSQGIGPDAESQPDLEKTIISETQEEVEWKIDLTVPKNGLDSAVVTETVPRISTGAYYDKVKSIAVTGLTGTEDYELTYKLRGSNEIVPIAKGTPFPEDVDQVYITFYKNTPHNESNQGLGGGTSSRIVSVNVVTENNKDWLDYAEIEDWVANNGHQNTASIGDITKDVTAHPINKHIVKEKPQSGFENKVIIDGTEYKAYQYTIRMDATETEVNNITDDYDEEVFEIYTGESVIGSDGQTHSDNGKIWYGNSPYSRNDTGVTQKATLRKTDGGDGIITTTSLPRDDNNNLYKYYWITYYLVMKDPAKATEKALANGGTTKFKNTAGWGDGESSVEFEYGHPIIDKTSARNGDKAEFTITINPDKVVLNNNQPMTLEDVFSNSLSINYDSIQITTEPANRPVTYDYYGNKGIFTVPDATKVIIKYNSKILGTGDINYWNHATLNGDYDDEVNEWAKIETHGEGDVSIFLIYLLKYGSGDLGKTLAGAKFRILDSELNPITYTAKLDPASGNSDKIGEPIVFETTADGKIMIGLSRYGCDASQGYRLLPRRDRGSCEHGAGYHALQLRDFR